MSDLQYITGLSKQQCTIYEQCLKEGPISMSDLATVTKIKRPTLYPLVRDLESQGYLVKVKRGKRTLYDAADPEVFKKVMEKKQNMLEDLLPELEHTLQGKDALPGIDLVKAKGVEQLYKEIFKEIEAGKEVKFLTSMGDLERRVPWAIDNYFESLKKAKNNKVKDLIRWDNPGKAWARRIRMAGLKHPCKLLPKDLVIRNDIAIYEGSVAFFSYAKRPHAFLIKRPGIYQTMQTLYSVAWELGKDR